MPLSYFFNAPGPDDRALFALWLMAFASYYVLKAVMEYRPSVPFWSLAFVVTSAIWVMQRTPGDDANLGQFPMLVLSFFSLTLVSQHIRVVPPLLSRLITLFADYSYSLFLIHLTTMRVIFRFWTDETIFRVVVSILVANVLGFVFAYLFERHYHHVADVIKAAVGKSLPERRSASRQA